MGCHLQKFAFLLATVPGLLTVHARQKIIGMHVHSYTDSDFGERESASDYQGNKGSKDAASHRQATFAPSKSRRL